MRKIRKHIDWGEIWQRKLFIDLMHTEDIIVDVRKVAKLRINAGKFRKSHESDKTKAIIDEKNCKKMLFSLKNTG